MTVLAENVVELALLQAGDRYVFGGEASKDDPDPKVFDCSELIEWVCARLGVVPRMPDGSWNQATHCRNSGTLISIAEGLATRGALLFRFSSSPFEGSRPTSAHVAISLGDGRTMEARSSMTTPQVGVFGNAASRTWTQAGKIPGVVYGGTAPTPVPDSGATWERPGDPILTLADGDRVFRWQGSIAAGDQAAHASYTPGDGWEGKLDELNDRIWITLARIVDVLMQHDERIGR